MCQRLFTDRSSDDFPLIHFIRLRPELVLKLDNLELAFIGTGFGKN